MPDVETFFVDTNVLLYSLDSLHPEKRDKARLWLTVLWETGTGRLSWQVLHEFYVNAERKLHMPVAPARSVVESFAHWRPVETTLPLIHRSWLWMDRARLPYWDGLIVAAAEMAGCAWLLSEDFQAGQRFGAVIVVNPFLQSPDQFGKS